MLSMVEDWKTSGLTQKAFGLLHGINVATLGYWVAKSKETSISMPLKTEMALRSASSLSVSLIKAFLELVC